MKRCISAVLLAAIALAAFNPACFAVDRYAGSAKDRAALEKTSQAIRDAFGRGDLDAIMKYHHPDVIKTLSYDRTFTGREAWKTDLAGTLARFHLEFVEHHVETVFFQGDTAVEQSTFAIRGTPKDGGAPFVLKGRAMVVYVRYKQSPTGWVSIRELIQPAK